MTDNPLEQFLKEYNISKSILCDVYSDNSDVIAQYKMSQFFVGLGDDYVVRSLE